MRENTDPNGSYAVIVVNPIPRVATYHALDWHRPWEERRGGEYTECGLGPVGPFREHSFSLLDPERARPCRKCYR